MLVNIQFSKYHIWKREELTNTSTRNIFGFAKNFKVVEFRPIHCKFLTETKELQPVYLSEVLQSTELGQIRRIEPNLTLFNLQLHQVIGM